MGVSGIGRSREPPIDILVSGFIYFSVTQVDSADL